MFGAKPTVTRVAIAEMTAVMNSDRKNGNSVSYSLDGLLIATVDASTLTLGGENILFNQYDINPASSADANVRDLLFGLFDNIVVTQVPEPASASLALLGVALLAVLRRRK